MPKVLWLLEHVRLRVDPLKDAAGSPFGKPLEITFAPLIDELRRK